MHRIQEKSFEKELEFYELLDLDAEGEDDTDLIILQNKFLGSGRQEYEITLTIVWNLRSYHLISNINHDLSLGMAYGPNISHDQQ